MMQSSNEGVRVVPEWSASGSRGLFTDRDSDRYDRRAVGLAFSGGGYRATLFHARAVVRLGDLAELPKIDRISSVSGGSITSGILAKCLGSPRIRQSLGHGRRRGAWPTFHRAGSRNDGSDPGCPCQHCRASAVPVGRPPARRSPGAQPLAAECAGALRTAWAVMRVG